VPLTWTAGILDLANTEATSVGGVDHITTGLGNDTIFGGTGNDTSRLATANNLIFATTARPPISRACRSGL